MTLVHKYTLWFLLGFLGLSLIIPGLMNMFRPSIGSDVVFAESISGKNHLRALNAMIAAMGVLSIWACFDLETSRRLVMGLGIILSFLVMGRIYSIFIDGMPSFSIIAYLIIELIMAIIFLAWPPAK